MTPTRPPRAQYRQQQQAAPRRTRHAYVEAPVLAPHTPEAVTPRPELQHNGGVNRGQYRTPQSAGGGEDLEVDGQEGEMDDEEAGEEEDEDEEGGIEEVLMDIDPVFDPDALGWKEIGNLASWTVSTCKPGCGVEALRDEDTSLFWQSDGPQPHHLNIHFSRLVSIVSLRIYLDFEADESYTPTKITLLAGTGYHDLIPFSTLDIAQPKGWIDVSLDDVGGGEDGRTLKAFLVQVKVVENHQNGKDTHVRGLKIFARDERVRRGVSEREVLEVVGKGRKEERERRSVGGLGEGGERGWLVEEDWMGEPELR